ncbi:MAG: glycosyltransferase family 4 protein [Patescibacteria group bacterium]|jgi:glycosyltransferase involved in cell wall biosynthesis
MRILQVNKFYYPQGGADKYFLDLSQALVEAGHEVATFAMAGPKNLASPFSPYFVSHLDFHHLSFWDYFKIPGRIIYSLEAKRKFTALLKAWRPDIIHLHNIYHQISPSILTVAKKFKIPVVMHVHDYKLISPNYQLFTRGKIDESSKPNKYYRCLFNRCFENSFLKSLLVTLEMYLHHEVLDIYRQNINYFITPSQFMKDKLIEYNWPPEKIKVIINPYPANLAQEPPAILDPNPETTYLLAFGRLSIEKGMATAISAAYQAQQVLKIAGRGPEEESLKKLNAKLSQAHGRNLVEFLGYQEPRALTELIKSAQAILLPSISYDNMPLSLLESLRLGKVVIGAKTGGIPELIDPGKTGFLFPVGDDQALAQAINNLANYDLKAIGLAAYERVKDYSQVNNCQAVLDLYEATLAKLKHPTAS